MKSKWTIATALALAVIAVAGCGQPAQKSQSPALPAVANLGTSPTLFGPTPLALGQEDRGYFATTALAAEEPLLMLQDRRSSYVRTDIWDLEDDLQPNISHHQMWRHAVDEGSSNR